MKRHNVMIVTLMLTALVMAVMLCLSSFNSQPARAEMSATAGDYTIISVANAGGADGAVVVVDNRAQRTLVYRISLPAGGLARINAFGKLDLAKAFAGK